MHLELLPASAQREAAGIANVAKIPMMEMTTSNSTKVNPKRPRGGGIEAGEQGLFFMSNEEDEASNA
jgi:hypothetical protein